MGTVFSQAVLAIALEIWVNLEVKRRMVRMDWAGWASVTDGKDVEGEEVERWDGEDGLGKSEEKIFNWKRQSIKRKF